MSKPQIKWAAQLAGVHEVSLLGTADLGFWQERLAQENLVPVAKDGQAQVLMVAADAKYFGVRFREVSFSIQVAQTDLGEAAFLVQAFNSVRFLAFCERVFFSTPYIHAAIRVSAADPSLVELSHGIETVFRAEMRGGSTTAASRVPARQGEAGWDGPVFLPGRPARLFFARISGQTDTYPFLPDEDRVTIRPVPGAEILQALVESHFVGREWSIRPMACHDRSKTYKRSEMVLEPLRVWPAWSSGRGKDA